MDQLQFGCHFDQGELHLQTQIMEEPAAANADSSKTEGNLKAIAFDSDKPLPPQNTGVAIDTVPSKRAHQTQEISHPFFYHTNQQFTLSTQPHVLFLHVLLVYKWNKRSSRRDVGTMVERGVITAELTVTRMLQTALTMQQLDIRH